MSCCSVDNELMIRHSGGKLQGLITIHVDDVKIAGDQKFVNDILGLLEREFGQLKIIWNTFVNCGVQHTQDVRTKEITLDQIEYAKNLKAIVHPELHGGNPETPCGTELHQLYQSLLGAVAYLAMTRVDAAVFISALQRHGHAPQLQHVKRLNKLLSWLQRHPKRLAYRKLGHDSHLRIISDAAFKKETEDGYSLRGALFLRASGDFASSSNVHVVDWHCKQQRHVCRSTFAAELLASCDSVDSGVLTAQMIFEIENGPLSAADARERRKKGGFIPIGLYLDAKSVYAAVSATFIKTPAEKSLLTHVQFLREWLDYDILTAMLWIDTRDMASDGLTKGTVDCAQLHEIMDGSFKLRQAAEIWKPKLRAGGQPTPVALDDNGETYIGEIISSYVVDCVEAFKGSATITQRCSRHHLRAGHGADILDGWDLSTPTGQAQWRTMIERDRPKLVVIGFPCTHWNTFVNLNYSHRPQELERLRTVDRSMLKLMVWTIRFQIRHKHFFLFENPASSRIWNEPLLTPIYDLPGVCSDVGHACAYNKRCVDGSMYLWKRHRWLGNSYMLVEAVCRKCNGRHEHARVESSETKPSGTYTPELADAILSSLKEVLRTPFEQASAPQLSLLLSHDRAEVHGASAPAAGGAGHSQEGADAQPPQPASAGGQGLRAARVLHGRCACRDGVSRHGL